MSQVEDLVAVPPYPPFITIDELRAAVQSAIEDETLANSMIEMACAAVRAEVSQTINVVEDDEVTLDGNGAQVLCLPELQVISVSEIALAGRVLGEDEYDWSSSGQIWRRSRPQHRYGWNPDGPVWPRVPRVVSVTYDHGWVQGSPQLEAARTVALGIAARLFRNPDALQSERIGDYSRAFVPTAAKGDMTEAERDILDPLRP